MLIFGRVHVAAEFVGREPKLGFEADISRGVFGRIGSLTARHLWSEILAETFPDGERKSAPKRTFGYLLSVVGYWGNGEAGTNLAVLACMAKIVGAAGAHAGKQSIAAFKKMFATVLIVVAVIAFAEGVMLTSLVTLRGRLSWYLIPAAVGLLMVWIVRIVHFRVTKHETDRMAWRKGALGEYEVGAELERLPDDYLVFNDVSTQEFGNFDHIVVGPKGIFAIETKNWTGLIGTNAAGEITRNGKPLWRSYIRMLERKVMMLREQIVVLTRQDDLFIRGLMVFPKAYIEAGAKTRNIHCLTVERLYDYFDECPKRLQPNEVERIARVVKSIADINSEGPEAPTPSVIQTRPPQVRGRRSEFSGQPAPPLRHQDPIAIDVSIVHREQKYLD